MAKRDPLKASRNKLIASMKTELRAMLPQVTEKAAFSVMS